MIKIKEFFKKITLRRLIVLIFLLIFNSYAWFIYATRVSNSITTHVVAWEVKFQAGADEIVSSMEIDIEKIYPGMDDFEREIEATNAGETKAVLRYAIREIRILGDTYIAGEDGHTPESLLNMLTDGTYPFNLIITVENDGEMEEQGGRCSLKISLTWDFELDENMFNKTEIDAKNKKDTEYGELASEFYKENPDIPSVQLKIDIIASQVV